MKQLRIFLISILLSLLSVLAWSFSTIFGHNSSNEELFTIKRAAVNADTPAPLLILLHGYGSNENDLFTFHSNIPENWMIVSARGPIQLGKDSYCWYQVKRDGEKMIIDPVQEEKSRGQIIALIREITTDFNIDQDRIYLAGFSQGAIMSESIALTHPELVKGFASFSGRLLDEVKPLVNPSDKLKQIRSFVSHGTEDKMLTIQYARENLAYIRSLGITPEYVEDATGHVISEKQFSAFLKWLGN